MLKPYPLNILKAQSDSSNISNLGQILIFTENSTPNYPYESFRLPPNYCPNQCFWRTPKYLFPAKIPDPGPRPQTIEPAPPPRIFNYRVPPSPWGLEQQAQTCKPRSRLPVAGADAKLAEIQLALAHLSYTTIIWISQKDSKNTYKLGH